MIKYIKPLPVSEEMLGAYLEGNLSKDDSLMIEEMMQSNVVFKEFVDEVSSLGGGVGFVDGDESGYEGYLNYSEDFELPEIPTIEELESADVDLVCWENMDYGSIPLEISESMAKEWADSVLDVNIDDEALQENYANDTVTNQVDNNMIMEERTRRIIEFNVGDGETAGSVGSRIGGDETAGSVGSRIGGDETAGSVGSRIGGDETAGSVGSRVGDSETAGSVGNMRPMQVGEPEMNEESIHVKQSYNDTCAIQSQRLILEKFGIHLTEDQLVQQAIDNGLYKPGRGTSMADMGRLLDLNDCPCTNYIGGNAADLTNALAQGRMVMMAVDSGELWRETGLGKLWERIEDKIPFIGGADHALLVTGIDASDPENVKVIVTDPGSGDLNKAYPLEQFIDAAKDSHCFMTITDNPVPNVFDAYNNPIMEHLPAIGGLQYHQFMLDYEPYMCSGKALPMDVASDLVSSISLSSCRDIDDEQRDDNSNEKMVGEFEEELEEPEYEGDEVPIEIEEEGGESEGEGDGDDEEDGDDDEVDGEYVQPDYEEDYEEDDDDGDDDFEYEE